MGENARRGFMPRWILPVCTLLALLAIPNAYSQQQANPPTITALTSGGVGFVTVTQGPNAISATIGQWSTPYPYGVSGRPLPGVEASGPRMLTTDIDVNDGVIDT